MSSYELATEGYLGSGEYESASGYGRELEEEFGAGAYEAEGPYDRELEEEEEEFGTGFESELEQYVAEIQQLGGEYESPLGEVEEMELATRLLEVQTEEELEQFLGNLVSRVARGVGGFLRSKAGKALGGILKNVAKTALPVVGGALGSVVAPGAGTAIGSKLGTLATRLFEVELEGMEQEDQEFEVARRYVRLAAASARNAALARRRANPNAAARAAVLAASRRYAPGLFRRFRVFASPAPFYWPQPVPDGDQPPAPAFAPPTFAAAAAPEPAQPPADEPPVDQAAGQASELEGEYWPGMHGAAGNSRRPQSGRWVRRGRKLVVLGI
jgi:uncharacterized protein (DUF697 family)